MERIYNWIIKVIGLDGLLHFETSALLVVILSKLLPIWLSCLIVALIGVAKEVYDKLHPKEHSCELKDFICDFAGILMGLALSLI